LYGVNSKSHSNRFSASTLFVTKRLDFSPSSPRFVRILYLVSNVRLFFLKWVNLWETEVNQKKLGGKPIF